MTNITYKLDFGLLNVYWLTSWCLNAKKPLVVFKYTLYKRYKEKKHLTSYAYSSTSVILHKENIASLKLMKPSTVSSVLLAWPAVPSGYLLPPNIIQNAHTVI
jgi:hypothetical protein